MKAIDIDEVQSRFSQLMEQAARGKTIVIAKAGQPIAKIVPVAPAGLKTAKRLGFLKGAFNVPTDFDRMQKQEIANRFGE